MYKRNYLVVALISLTLIPLELIWTRILSAEFFYTFAFLVLSLAILGLGLGGLAIRLFEKLGSPRLLGWHLALVAGCAVAGPALVFALAPDFSLLFKSWATVGKLILTILILMSAYFFAGIALSSLFKHNYRDMPRLYMADLIAAGLAVLIAIWAMNTFGTPQASLLVALPALIASIIVTRGFEKLVPVALALAAILLAPLAPSWLELPREERAPVIFKHWDALSKIKVYEYGPDSRGINVDNVANSPIYRFDGDWAALNPDSTEWPIDVSYLIRQFDSCVFFSLGAGGGGDVLQALVEGAAEVHAVEVNGFINRMMLLPDTSGYTRAPLPEPDSTATDTLAAADSTDTAAVPPLMSAAEFSGHLYNDPRVTVVTDDARAYARRFTNKFDVIYSLSSNTWAALASGSFALAENYLFTTDAFVDYWRALSDSGFMMMEHQMYVPRLVSEVIDALTRSGVATPTDHFAVYDLPQMRRKIILLSKRPLTDSLRYNALLPLTPERFDQIHLLFPPANDSIAGTLIPRIITEGWRNVADTAPIDISPVTDDRPFVAQLGLWRNFTEERREKLTQYAEFAGFPLSKVMLVIVLGVVVLIALPINLLPYLRKNRRADTPAQPQEAFALSGNVSSSDTRPATSALALSTHAPRLRAAPWLYFFCIGVAFMAVEIVLIQKYALLLGSSLYSTGAILMILLVASGLGSRFADSFRDRTPFFVIAGWLLLEALLFRHITAAAAPWPLTLRMLLAAALIFPLGFFMGMPFPKGALRVGELIDWGFAVNGAASVLGSVLVLIISISHGFTIALLLSAAVYMIAFLLLRLRRSWHTLE